MSSAYGGDFGLETLGPDGEVPETRMKDAERVQDFVRRMWENDEDRSWLRSRVAGLVGGNPPFRNSKLRDAGAAGMTNVNWGTSRSYMENGSGSFYDLSSEAPGIVQILQTYGPDYQRRMDYSRKMSANMDKLIRCYKPQDYHMQQSQWEMTLYGCGPLFYEDAFKVFPRSAHCGDLKVPERTKSDVEYYEVACMDVDWYPAELYEFIAEAEWAKAAGWRPIYTRKVIANAMDIRQPEARAYDWEFYQQELKNSSFTYYDDTKICHCAIVWWKEFDGSITQTIIERDATSTTGKVEYLFFHRGRYKKWQNFLHPMYFDRGHGGFHHSVTGLGVKLYGPMMHENRLLCNMMDKAYAPDILFRPTSTQATQKFALAHMKHYGMLPEGWDVVQTPVKGFVQDGLAMFQTSTELMKSNLSNYRQQVPMQKRGNPATKFEKQMEAQQASAVGKTTFNRYYNQLDTLYEEMVRRACDLNSPCCYAKKYQEMCEEDGVPRECFGRVETVTACRVMGEGSAFLRKEALNALAPFVASLPEDGQKNWIDDKVAAECGQHAVSRYNPDEGKKQMSDEQDERVRNQVAAMKVGLPPVINSSQNPLRFAAGFLQACVQAIQSVQQGANPEEVLRFVSIAGPAAMAHVKRVINDPIRAGAAQKIAEQLQQVQKMAEQLEKMVQKQKEQRNGQQKKTQAAMTDEQLKTAKTKNDIAIKRAKAQQQMQIKDATTRQQLALADMSTASELHNKNRLASLRE